MASRSSTSILLAGFAAVLFLAGPALAVPVIVGGAGAGATTDLLDAAQGGKIVGEQSTPSPIFPYNRAIGVTGVGGETTNTIFADTSGGGAVQSFVVRTPAPITLEAFDLLLSQDGASVNRSATSARIYASSDGINYTEISDTTDVIASLSNYQTNFGDGAITISDAPAVTAQFFRVETVSATAGSPRVREFDGFGTVVPFTVDPILFNAASNTGVDEPAGLSVNFTVSSAVGGIDDPQGAFGNNDGPVEPSSFIFADGGVVDNGNGIIGDGGETVDFIQWQTTAPVFIAGFEINLSGDGVDVATRGTELVRFLVEGVEVDLFDNDQLSGTIARLFAGGNVTGNDFRIEFTRSSTQGPRILEINAIAAIVPEPATATLGMLGLAGLMMRRRRMA